MLKTLIDLVEPVTRKIGDLERTNKEVGKNLENIDNLAVSSLEKIAGDYDENIEINDATGNNGNNNDYNGNNGAYGNGENN